MTCVWCRKKYIAYDTDAGEAKERFCSRECAEDWELAVVDEETERMRDARSKRNNF